MNPAALIGTIDLAVGAAAEVLSPLLMKLRFWIEDTTGWLEQTTTRLTFAGTSVDMVDLLYGIKLHDVIALTRFVVNESLNFDAVVGTRLGQNAISMVMGTAVEAALLPAIQTIRNIAEFYRGNRPTWAFNIIFMGNIFEYIDEDTLAYLMALGGENFLGTVSYVQQALGWLYDTEQHDVLAELRRAVNAINDAATFDIETYLDEARWFLSEAIRTYHKTFLRILSIVDRIIERAIARLWELRVHAWTLYKWWENGLVTPTMFGRHLTQIQIEAEMTRENVEKALELCDEALSYLDLEGDIDEVVGAVQRVAMVRYDIAKKVINAIGSADYHEQMAKLVRAITKFAAIRSRVSEDLALGIAPQAVSYLAPEPVSRIEIESIEGLDVA